MRGYTWVFGILPYNPHVSYIYTLDSTVSVRLLIYTFIPVIIPFNSCFSTVMSTQDILAVSDLWPLSLPGGGGAMVLGKLPVPGRPTSLKLCLQLVRAGAVWTFFLSSIISLFFLPLSGRRDGRVVRRCWVNFQCWGVQLIWIIVGQGPIVLAVGAVWGCLDIFSLIYHFSFLSPSLWETARYRLKYCLKGPLSPKQPTNQTLPGIFSDQT